MARPAGPAKRSRRRKGNPWTVILLVLPASLVVLPTSIVLGLGMIPTLVAFVIDRDPEKTAAITVGGPNFCGCLPFAIGLWKHDHTLTAALKVFADPFSWAVIYGAAGIGWVLYYTIPPLVAGNEVARLERRIEELRQIKVKLVQEWGPDVAGDVFDSQTQAEAGEG